MEPDVTAQKSIPVDALQERLLPVADRVMVLMLSRPASGTLRDTKVTIVTIYLAIAVAVVGLVLAILGVALATAGGQAAWVLAALVLLLLAGGCADLAIFGVRQRILMARG
ncbi:MAG: hypothetical protein QOK05_541 [Chloroflexota bacterium]|nr:hypothetical protein [Chloroflexota bacterium]